MLTGAASPMVRSEALRRGAVECLSKPLDADEIVSTLARGQVASKAGDP
jgi:ActR/RegA family two-component response regulator